MGVLAVGVGIIVVCAIAVAAFLGLVIIVVAPSRRVRAEPPLDPNVEAALLLGEDPDEVAREYQEPVVGAPEPEPVDGDTV